MRRWLPEVAVIQGLLGCYSIFMFVIYDAVPGFMLWTIAVGIMYIVAAAGLELDRSWGWRSSMTLHAYTIGEKLFMLNSNGVAGHLPKLFMLASLVTAVLFLAFLSRCRNDENRVGFLPMSPWLAWPLVAVAIVASVAGSLRIYDALSASKAGAAHSDIMACRDALQLYYADVSPHRYPSTLTQLLRDNAAGWSGPYMATITSDPWNNEYQYQTDGTTYTLMSVHDHFGADVRETIRYVSTDSEAVWLP